MHGFLKWAFELKLTVYEPGVLYGGVLIPPRSNPMEWWWRKGINCRGSVKEKDETIVEISQVKQNHMCDYLKLSSELCSKHWNIKLQRMWLFWASFGLIQKNLSCLTDNFPKQGYKVLFIPYPAATMLVFYFDSCETFFDIYKYLLLTTTQHFSWQ